MSVENIKIEAMKVFYGVDTAQVEKVTIRAGILKSALSGKYFTAYAKEAGVLTKHAFWFNTGGDTVYDLSFVGTPASGSLVISLDAGDVSLAWDDVAADLQAAIRALDTSLENMTVSGSFAAGFTLTFVDGHEEVTLGANTLMTSAPAAVTPTLTLENTSSEAPELQDAYLHEVDISSGSIDTIFEIASALSAVIDGLNTIYDCTVSANVLTMTQLVNGYVPAAHDAKIVGKETTFGFEVVTQGDVEEEMGCIDGDIEVAFEESFIDVKCHAEGATPVAQLKNGVNSVEVTMNLEETSNEKLKKMFTKSGGSFVPDNGTEVFGMGTYKQFENMFKFATKLRLHPARLLAGDRSGDFTFHKAIPNLSGLTFSGENVFTLPVTFKVYPAEGIDSKVNYFAIGDGSQNLA